MNSQHQLWQNCALPIELLSQTIFIGKRQEVNKLPNSMKEFEFVIIEISNLGKLLNNSYWSSISEKIKGSSKQKEKDLNCSAFFFKKKPSSNNLIVGKISNNNFVKNKNIRNFRKVTLQPTGAPFLIFSEIFDVFEQVKHAF